MDVYARPWKAAITEAGLRGLMVTHPEVSGLPMRAWPVLDSVRVVDPV
jgi:hypothetical protein